MTSYHGRHGLADRMAAPPRRRGLKLGIVAGAALASVLAAVTACSATQGGSQQPVAATAALGAPAAAAPALTGPNLKVTQAAAGTLVTNDGFTVYRFAKDTAKPSKSACNGSCAQAWPPVLATDTPWLKGIPSDKVGTVSRADGTKQLTLGGWPLYRYAKDGAPGDTKGQGVGGTWSAVGPDGKPAKIASAVAPAPASSAAPAPAPSGGTSGYSSDSAAGGSSSGGGYSSSYGSGGGY